MAVVKRVLRALVIAVIGLYFVFAAGLAVLNAWSPKAKHSEDAVIRHSREAHEFIQLSSGIHSLQARLAMIERAKHTLDLEFFIYNLDESSRIFTQALVAKAQAGVKVRILVDFSAPVFQLKPVYARYLKSKGIEVRYYNTSAFYQLLTSQHRSHRKLLMADGVSVITGGRNIGNEYFDLKREYNFLDTDVEIRGPVVKAMQQSFEMYWNSDFSREPDGMEKPLDSEEQELVDAFLQPQAVDQEILARVAEVGGAIAAKARVHVCRDVSFVTDFPNQGEENRKVLPEIVRELALAKREILGESPYFVIRKGGYEILEKITKQGVALKVLTNSLYSTDAFYTVATMFFRLDWLADSGLTLMVFNGKPVPGQSYTGYSGEDSRWGIHSKRAVVDGQTVLIGTYNVDPRSANLNSELMVVCRGQKDFAAEVAADIQARLANSSVAIEGEKWSLRPILENATWGQLTLALITLPLSNLFDFLL